MYIYATYKVFTFRIVTKRLFFPPFAYVNRVENDVIFHPHIQCRRRNPIIHHPTPEEKNSVGDLTKTTKTPTQFSTQHFFFIIIIMIILHGAIVSIQKVKYEVLPSYIFFVVCHKCTYEKVTRLSFYLTIMSVTSRAASKPKGAIITSLAPTNF